MIEIRSGDTAAMLTPARGGAVMSLTFGGRNILRPAISECAVANDPREAACYPCAPWFSRLYGGLTFSGVTYDLAPTLPACDPDTAMHGVGWVNPWRVTEKKIDRLVCRFDYAPRPRAFPFPFSAEQRFSVSKDAFEIELSIENTGDAPMPAGLGLHPFFPRTPETRLEISSPVQWMAPQTGAPSSPVSFDLPGGALPREETDFSAEGWGGEASIVQRDMQIRLTATTPILHLYAPAKDPFFCIEPVTHLPGAFGADILQPGAVKKISMQIRI